MADPQEILLAVKHASAFLYHLQEDKINQILQDLATQARQSQEQILKANQQDLARMGPDNPKYDRLKLTSERIEAIAIDIENVVKLPSPLGSVLSEKKLNNGLHLQKTSVPIGVIGVIYEARPNVTFDVFSLCLKAGNACVLKGGSDAEASNSAIVALIRRVLASHGIDENVVVLMPATHQGAAQILQAVDLVDVIIPRGSQQLINFVRENAKVPVIETGAGIVHTYYDEFADSEKGLAIVHNAKTRRVSVCNALDCLLVHRAKLVELAKIVQPLAKFNVHLYADREAYDILINSYPTELLSLASEEHFGTEFLDYKMAIKTVSNIEEALAHIATHSSKHSEAIITENQDRADLFLRAVDAAAVYANTSTAFTDGAQFGLGAEIGISTQKLHARGPMGLMELTTYKWIIRGTGQVRE